MARRRYISTQISLDAAVDKLAREYGDFAALLYTWMIPHAEDNATITGDPDELMFTVIPRRRDKTIEDVIAALEGMEAVGLISWDRANKVIYFPPENFYRYQSYIREDKRRKESPSEQRRQTAPNSDDYRQATQNTVSPSPSPSPTPSHTPTENLETSTSSETEKVSRGGMGETPSQPSNQPTMPESTETEREILKELKSIPGYPLDYPKDLEFIRTLAVDFPGLDILTEAQKWRVYKMDKPLAKKSNPRLQFRNWCEIAIKRQQEGVAKLNGKSPGNFRSPPVKRTLEHYRESFKDW